MDSIIVIPALNPPESLVSYVEGLIDAGADAVIVLNDGSGADKEPIFDKLGKTAGCTVLTHTVNRGKGRALKTAFSYILENEAWRGRFVITADSDGQHLADDILRMDAAMSERAVREGAPRHGAGNAGASDCGAYENCFLMLGVRDFRYGHVPFRSFFGNMLTRSLFRLLYGVSVADTQTGLRGISYGLLHRLIGLKGERFEYEMNMLTDAALAKIPIGTMDITTVYIGQNSESHFDPIKDSIRIYKILLGTFFKYALSSVGASLVDLAIYTAMVVLLPQSAFRILEATVIARVFSSFVNYWCNKQLVFGDKSRAGGTIFKYYTLCVAVMLCSAGLVTLFSRLIPVASTFIKIVVDCVLYFFNYRIQRRFIFKYKN